MTTPYTEDAFAYRVDFASRVISAGASQTRSFDTCFEMHDGDAVAVAIYRRSRRNPKLRRNLWRYLGRHSIVPTAFANRRKTRAELAIWAAELRSKAREEFARTMERWEREKEDKRTRAIAAGYTSRQLENETWSFVRPDGSLEERSHTTESSAYHFACNELDRLEVTR